MVALELSDAELDRIFSQAVIIGSAFAGQATVVGAITHSNANLAIESGQDVLVQADITTPSTLTLRAANNVTQSAASFITTGTLNIFVDTPDTDAPGGTNTLAGALAITSSVINGNADADTLYGTAFGDVFNAGDGDDFIYAQLGGSDTVNGGNGADKAYFGAAWGAGDSFDGGAGADVLILQGNYTLNSGFGAITSVDKVRLLSASETQYGYLGGGSFDYSITTADSDVPAGQRMIVEGVTLAAGEELYFDGSAELDGSFQVFGGAANDILIGSQMDDHLLGGAGVDFLTGNAGADRLRGGAGGDVLNGCAGADILIYAGPSESSSLNFDTLIGFNPSEDQIDLPTPVTGWTGNITSGHLTAAAFDTGLAAAVNAALQPNSAVLFTPTSGDFVGRTFAVVDANGDGNYTANADYVFEIVTPTAPMDSTPTYFV